MEYFIQVNNMPNRNITALALSRLGFTIEPMTESPANRLKRARLAAGYKRAIHFCDAHKVHQGTYSKHETGRRGLRLKQAEDYAELLGNCSAAWLLTGEGRGPGFDANVAPAKLSQTTVVGAVQAGEWHEAADWPDEDRYPVLTPLNGFHETDLFALEVRGNSINEVYPDGSIITCVTLPALGREPKDGELVICQRMDNFGLLEATCKRIRTAEDGVRWLWPESDDPEHQTPISMASESGEEVVLRGVVIWGMRNELL